jgi:chemotaxis protein methyltransferase CheR
VTELAPLTESEFRRLCEFLYRRTGMVFTEAKRYYVERRVFERMQAKGTRNFENYFARLRSGAEAELEPFVNAFTVNETYFYREEHQLACLSASLLGARLAAVRDGPLRIWSVPCSSGEEPYSIAIWLLEHWPFVDAYDIEIVGSDIDTDALALARRGRYGKRALTRLPEAVRDKYFEREDDETWTIAAGLRDSVRFTAANIVEVAETRPHGRFDVIFCRNVLIYFDDASRRLAAENLYENLMPGGFICLGHAESMSRISPLFEAARFDDTIVYRRPAA